MSSIFVKHFELPCVERCYINKLALPCLACLALPCLAFLFMKLLSKIALAKLFLHLLKQNAQF